MNNHLTTTKFVITGVPALVGLGVAWLGVRLVRNEARILLRQVELEMALEARSRKTRRELLLGR